VSIATARDTGHSPVKVKTSLAEKVFDSLPIVVPIDDKNKDTKDLVSIEGGRERAYR